VGATDTPQSLTRRVNASFRRRLFTTRTHVSGQVGNVFKAADIALPANISELPPQS